MFLLTPFTFVFVQIGIYIPSVWNVIWLQKVYNIICSLFWFRNCFLYIFVYAKEFGTNFLKHHRKQKLFPSNVYVLCASCMHACITPDTRTPFSISCYIIQSFGFIFPLPKPTTDIHHMRICTRISDEKKLYLLLIHREVSCFCLWNKIQCKVFA